MKAKKNEAVMDCMKLESQRMISIRETASDLSRQPKNVETGTHVETESMDWNEVLDKSKTVIENEVAKGHLFMTCIRCTSMLMINLECGLVPPMPLSNESNTENGMVTTVCRSCEARELSIVGVRPDLVEKFKDLALHPNPIRGSDIIKPATMITNATVDVMRFKNRVLFVYRDGVIETVSSSDTIASVDVSMVDSLDNGKILLKGQGRVPMSSYRDPSNHS